MQEVQAVKSAGTATVKVLRAAGKILPVTPGQSGEKNCTDAVVVVVR